MRAFEAGPEAEVVEDLPVRGWHIGLIASCVLMSFADGFDTLGISFAGPLIAQDWHMSPAALGSVFSAALLGGMVGALTAETLGRRVPRHILLAACLVWIGVFSAATALAANYVTLLVLRLVTGLALGAATPLLLATVAQSIPLPIRARAMAFVIGGLPLGGMASGIVSAQLGQSYGWRAIFCAGAALPLALIPLAYLAVRRAALSARPQSAHGRVGPHTVSGRGTLPPAAHTARYLRSTCGARRFWCWLQSCSEPYSRIS